MLMYGGSGVQVLPRFQDKFLAYFNEPKNTIEVPIQENTEIPGKMLHNQYDCTSFEQQVYRAGRLLIRKVLLSIIWGVPPAGGPLL